MDWHGSVSCFLRDDTRELILEGALNAGKTTAALWKIRTFCFDHPGIKCLIARYAAGDTTTLLCPAWEAICQRAGESPVWHAEEEYYGFPNASRVYAFGLLSPERGRRYAKVRGWDGAVIHIDQAEELPPDLILELLGRPRQQGYPHQVIFTPNPMSVNDALSKMFPIDNHIPHRHYYSVSLDDNAHNLEPGTVEALKRAYPPSHAKHRTLILGLRGLNVIGDPVYGAHLDRPGAFRRDLHVRPLTYNPKVILHEGFDFGLHHPCWLIGQQPYAGGWHLLGGILGRDLYLDEFLPLVKRYRAQWFPTMVGIQTCCDPAGSHENSQGIRANGLMLLKEAGFDAVFRENSNAPDVRAATIERIAAHMLRRSVLGDEAFSITADPSRFLVIAVDGVREENVLADGCEAGYVWDPLPVSVGSKQVRRPKKDDWYDHFQNILEYLELNFGADRPTQEARAKRDAERKRQQPAPMSSRGSQGWMGG